MKYVNKWEVYQRTKRFRYFKQVRQFKGTCTICPIRHPIRKVVKQVLNIRTKSWPNAGRWLRSPIYTRAMHAADKAKFFADLHRAGKCTDFQQHYSAAFPPSEWNGIPLGMVELGDLSTPCSCWSNRTGLDRGTLKIKLTALGGRKRKLISRTHIIFGYWEKLFYV